MLYPIRSIGKILYEPGIRMFCSDIFKLPEHNIQSWSDIYSLYDHHTLFRQRFSSIQEIDGYLCLIVSYGTEITGFLPPSELGIENPTESDLHRLLRMPVPVMLYDIRRKENIVLLSRKVAVTRLEKRLWKKVQEENIKPGDILTGTVLEPARPNKPLVVEIAGIKAEVPKNELYWEQWIDVKELQKRYPIYTDIKMVVTNIDLETKTLNLSAKALIQNLLNGSFSSRYKVNSIFSGKVVLKKDYGIFVSLPGGVLCFCGGAKKYSPGDAVTIKISKIVSDRQKIVGTIL